MRYEGMSLAVRVLRRILWSLGYAARPRTGSWDPMQLERIGSRPRTIVDVGVAQGTPELYGAFPDAHLVLIEPLVEFQPCISQFLDHHRGTFFPVGLGAHPGMRTMYIEPKYMERSSLFKRAPAEASGERHSTRGIAVTTLDALLAEHHFAPPFGLKIDAEGCEYEIIQGAAEFLRLTDFVIAEVAVPRRFDGGYEFLGFIELMSSRGFVVSEVLDIGRAPDGSLAFLDMVFTRKQR
ncbi:MAG: FkbM family methyltransferase [Acidobacteria bacterium]|nr:FkbM family methyltransferase [Acidobacteriota bacterium]